MSVVLAGTLLALQAAGGGWQQAPSLPRPVTNNAVAAVSTPDGTAVVSFLGLASGRTASDVVDWAFRWDLGSEAWRELSPVPGPPRLAAAAEGVGARVYLFGGYTVAADGAETTLDRVDVYDPATDGWSRGAPVPVAVDDAVSGVWRDSLVYLVGGWHDEENVTLVQLYDPAADRWRQATPLHGVPVFGHAGAVARDAIVYLDGVAVEEESASGPDQAGRRFVMEGSSWRGDIDPTDPARITWRRLPDHPGPLRYRAAAATVGTRVVFAGGSDNPYNYDGIGYDGVPSEPVWDVLLYDLVTGAWSRRRGPTEPTMDHRALVRAGGWLVLAGGMTAGQTVSGRVWRVSVLDLVAAGR